MNLWRLWPFPWGRGAKGALAKRPRVAASAGAERAYDVLVFPVVDWRYRFQRPQQLSREFARRGHRVFYFSTTPAPAICACETEPELVEPNIYVLPLPGTEDPPDIYRDLPTEAQLAVMEAALRRLRERFDIGATLAIVNYPFWGPLARRLTNSVVLYDCMDDYTTFRNAGPPARELEAAIVRDADLVVCSSRHLQARFESLGRESILVRNAVNPADFEAPPASLAIPRAGPVAGCHGAIGSWTDLELIAHAARALPDVRFVLVGGSEGVDLGSLAALPNVALVGEVPYERLPAYIHSFDVGLLPYRVCDYARASDPLKVWEYLSAGKPVVAVRFPEIERLDGLVTLTGTPEEFVHGIQAALAGDSPAQALARRQYARQNTWSHRCEEIRSTVAPLFPLVSVIVLSCDQRQFTQTTLTGLERFSHYPNLELVLVDNGSTDGTAEWLEAWAAGRPNVRVVLNSTNLGFSAGNNAGARVALGEYLAFLNNDVFVTDGWVGDLLAHFRANPKLGLLGPVTNRSGNESVVYIGDYLDMEQMAALARRYTRAHRGERTALRVMHFFCVMIPRRVWEEVGELDEGYGIGFFEDDDYTMRVLQAGYEVACAEDVFIHHHHSASFGALPQSVYDELFERNRRYFESKWDPWVPPKFRPEVQARYGG